MSDFNSIIPYTGTGARTRWDVAFPGDYISPDHVFVVRGGTSSPAVWDAGQVVIDPPVPLGEKFRIQRFTPALGPIVDFVDGAGITEQNLDTATRQALLVSAEASDRSTEVSARGILAAPGTEPPVVADLTGANGYLLRMIDNQITAWDGAALIADFASAAGEQANIATVQANLSQVYAEASETSKEEAEAAVAAAIEAAGLVDDFNSKYLGAKADDPTTDNEGGSLELGALYWNTAAKAMRMYDGGWLTVYAASTDFVRLNEAQTLANKSLSLSTNSITGTLAQFNAAVVDGDFVPTTGTGATGTWNISILGNATTASTAALATIAATLNNTVDYTPRSINAAGDTWNPGLTVRTPLNNGATGAIRVLASPVTGRSYVQFTDAGVTAWWGSLWVDGAGRIGWDTPLNVGGQLWYRDLPTESRGANYWLVLEDRGKVLKASGNVGIPRRQGSVEFPVGSVVVIYNNTDGTIQLIQDSDDYLRLAGTTQGGNLTVAPRGMVTVTKIEWDVWIASGNVS